tara:strand:+ start:803 stop:988 length:186 start_codon:yes stop_codon:yes gene_type:complete
MERAEFLKFLLKTGTSDIDLQNAGFTTNVIKDVKKGRKPVTPALQYFVMNRFHEMMNDKNS